MKGLRFSKNAVLNSEGLRLAENRNPFSEGLRLAENRNPISNKGLRFFENAAIYGLFINITLI